MVGCVSVSLSIRVLSLVLHGSWSGHAKSREDSRSAECGLGCPICEPDYVSWEASLGKAFGLE